MPSVSPKSPPSVLTRLAALGEALKDQRKRLRVSATTTAEAAGMSRTTLHRIEAGEPSVTIGAYMNAATALGLELRLLDPERPDTPPWLPEYIRLSDFPELAKLAWQRDAEEKVTPKEALSLYERNWRHLNQEEMSLAEREFLETLIRAHGGGRTLV